MIPYHGSQYSGHGGHYESWFLRANHPHKPQAFWIRYTLFVPADDRPSLGELWAIWFDAGRDQVVAVKNEYPLTACHFGREQMDVRLPAASLASHALTGHATHAGHTLRWDLRYGDGGTPLLLLPENLYQTKLPKAKALVSRPNVAFDGSFEVDGEQFEISHWPGSENHNWGRQHTDQYAWGQVAGFDNREDAFLECISARVKLGPVYSPWLTVACLRLGDETLQFNRISTALRAEEQYHFFDWSFRTRHQGRQLTVHLHAPASHFTALTYYNPPAGSKTCLNSKIATCTVTLEQPGAPPLSLYSAHRAAFEILTDRSDHGLPLAV